MEKLTVGRGFAPQIVEKAAQALRDGFRRPILASHGRWQQISVGYRHRLLLKGDGSATLLTHEQMNRHLSKCRRNCK
ncbi:hypothetical protein [Aeromonas phage 14AhydR10PP]|nr:hypothetical protein [Aeromonas phage 14AhydR10PP]